MAEVIVAPTELLNLTMAKQFIKLLPNRKLDSDFTKLIFTRLNIIYELTTIAGNRSHKAKQKAGEPRRIVSTGAIARLIAEVALLEPKV